MEKVVAEKDKRMQRLKEIWSAKSMEFREAVFSLLGWKLDFLQNGRVRVTHMFAGNSDDQSIEFDGEKGEPTHAYNKQASTVRMCDGKILPVVLERTTGVYFRS